MKIYLAVYILTIIDIGMTILGIKGGWVEEGNPLMLIMNHYPVQVGILLALAIGIILKWMYLHHLNWVKYPLAIITVIKIGVLILHAEWIIQII
jgi:hypothetical protein